VADEKIDENETDVGLELAVGHAAAELGDGHEQKLLDFVVAGGEVQAGAGRGEVEVKDVDDVAVQEAGARVEVEGGDDAGGGDPGPDEGRGERGLLVGLGEDAREGGVGRLDAAGDGAVELAGEGEEVGAAAGAPDGVDGGVGPAGVGGEVRAAGGNTEEGRGEALEGHEAGPAGAEDAKGLAVAAGEDVREEVPREGGVDGGLEGGGGVGVWVQGDGEGRVVDGEDGRPGHLVDDGGAHEPVGAGIGAEEEAVEGLGVEGEGDTGCVFE
jgi:hypothetical protein